MFLIVGASLAGASAAVTLRDEGFDGRIVLIGEEPYPPYEGLAASRWRVTNCKSKSDTALRLAVAGAWPRGGCQEGSFPLCTFLRRLLRCADLHPPFRVHRPLAISGTGPRKVEGLGGTHAH